MATYNWQQLYGSGSLGEDLTGVKTFTFTNPSGSAYFTMETLKSTGYVYTPSSPKNFIGTYIVSQSHSLVTSSYIASVNIPPGVSSFTFNPATTATGVSYYLRGTGNYSLTIS